MCVRVCWERWMGFGWGLGVGARAHVCVCGGRMERERERGGGKGVKEVGGESSNGKRKGGILESCLAARVSKQDSSVPPFLFP